MRDFRIGFTGSASGEVAVWVAEQVKGDKRICVPFAGSCKTIAAMARADTTIESWDTQIVSRAIIDGVFRAKRIESAVDKPRFVQGYMHDTRSIKKIDAASAGFIDYVGTRGTLADKAACFSAVIKTSHMGRLTHWGPESSFDKLWDRFQSQREMLTQFTDLPGEFIHHEENVFEARPSGQYDVIQLDPPKPTAIGYDIYSTNFGPINKALGGKHELPRWSFRDVLGQLRPLIQLPAPRVVMMYVSDVRPGISEIRALLSNYGTLAEDVMFPDRVRYGYGLLLQKGEEGE